EHSSGALRAPVAWVRTVCGERYGAFRLQGSRRRVNQQPDLPMARMKTNGDRSAVFGANASVCAQQQDLRPLQCTGIPPHAHILTETEEVTGGPLQQHVGAYGKATGGSACGCGARL